jgi:hypothetical protein
MNRAAGSVVISRDEGVQAVPQIVFASIPRPLRARVAGTAVNAQHVRSQFPPVVRETETAKVRRAPCGSATGKNLHQAGA